MKKRMMSLVAGACVCFYSANAQWSTSGNALTGGTSSTPNEWLGSSNLYDVIFKTNNTERMRMQSGGNVIIGPSAGVQLGVGRTPAATYNVGDFYDSFNDTRRVLMINGSNGTLASAQFESGNDVGEDIAIISLSSGYNAYGATDLNKAHNSLIVSNSSTALVVCAAYTTTAVPIIFANGGHANSNEKMRIDASGNLAPGQDNTYSCGTSAKRWSAVWAANGTIQTSDKRFKKNISDLGYGIKDIMKLRPVSYQWIKNSNGTRLGLIAQELKEVIGEVVIEGTDENKNLGVIYTELIPVLIKGVQEQQKMIDDLKTEVAKLQGQKNNDQINSTQRAIPTQTIELGNSPMLFQNSPNPFGEGTSVKYFVPENSNAQIVFYDEFGSKLKEYAITEKGMGQLNLGTVSLAKGTYSYSLVVNGKIVDTKKMMKVE